MRIGRTTGGTGQIAAPEPRGGPRPGFALPAEPAGEPAAAPADIASLCGLSGLLAAGQGGEPGPPAAGDAAASAHGRATLDALAALQAAALEGGGAEVLRTLSGLVAAMPRAAEPGLDAVLQAIAQRAAVELARAG